MAGDHVRSVTWHGAGDLRYEQRDLPDQPPPGQVRIQVGACGICGTDLSEYVHGPVMIRPDSPHPLTGMAPPVVLGHELAGRIVAAGAGVDPGRVGDRAAVDACWRCGTCQWCRRGEYHLCRIGASVGLHSHGGLAEYADVPEYCVVPLPDAVDDTVGALAEPLSVALHAMDRAAVAIGESVTVVGFGPIGAAVALLAGAAGASAIYVIEPLAGRRSLAEPFADEVLDPDAVDCRAEIRRRTGRAGADVVFDCTGAPAVLGSSIRLSRKGGRTVAVGVSRSTVTFPLSDLVLSERSLLGSIGYHNDLPRVVDLLASGRVDAAPLVTAEVPLDQCIEGAFDALRDGRQQHMKILVRP